MKDASTAYALTCEVDLRFRYPDRIVVTDPRMLQTILKNLIWNAIKYSGRATVVEVDATSIGDAIRIEVRDRGCGIANEDLVRVFEAFERSAQRHGPIDGLGLGLHIVRETAQALKHPIAVRSTLGEGTVMSVTVPAWSPCGRADG